MRSTKPQPSQAKSEFEFAALWEADNYRKAIVAEFAPYLVGEVLEIGAGIGQMTRAFQTQHTIHSLTCVEPNPEFARLHRKTVGGVRFIEGTVDALPDGFEADCVVSVNVLEHIEDDKSELSKYKAILARRNGFLCLLVPACPELYSRIDKDFGHFRRYEKEELVSKLRDQGFNVERNAYFNSLGYFAWLLAFKWIKNRSFNPAQVRFYDKLIFPAIHWMERHISRPFRGQSLIAVARA